MSSFTGDFSKDKDLKLKIPNKVTKLNPNAAEFVPSALRTAFGSNRSSDPTMFDVPGPSEKAILDRSDSAAVSNNSDDEAHQYWHHQLPDDITPDFKVMGEDELQPPGQLSLDALSIHDHIENSRFFASAASQLLGTEQDISPSGSDNLNLSEKIGYSVSPFAEKQSVVASRTPAANNWGQQFIDSQQQFTNETEGYNYGGDYSASSLNNSTNENVVLQDDIVDPVQYLASQFPGFAVESLADVYYANGCDLNLTIEILTQLEMQVDGDFYQNRNSTDSAAPILSSLDFPALPVSEAQNRMSNVNAVHTIDFASAVRKLAPQDSGHRKYDKNVSGDDNVGSSRGSQLLTSQNSNSNKLAFGDKLRSYGVARATPVWLETGEAVGNIYSESREEARDFARLRNACFEQARQAYLIGNKALAKELSLKGQLFNLQMKAAHAKAGEAIYRQRNPASPEIQGYGQADACFIDLHGLHVTEAIQKLKRELSKLRSRARSAGQPIQLIICVGTGHHTKGSRTPARLPVAIEQFLLEEGLRYTQPTPGQLRVLIY